MINFARLFRAVSVEVIKESKEDLRFPKEERLHHRSLVEGLFRTGKSFYEFPFRVTWRKLSLHDLEKNFRSEVPSGISVLQFMVTVPKKKRRKAVDRVKMRRRIKECWRLNRLPLRECLNNKDGVATMSVSLVYIHDKNLPYNAIEGKIRGILTKLEAHL